MSVPMPAAIPISAIVLIYLTNLIPLMSGKVSLRQDSCFDQCFPLHSLKIILLPLLNS